MSKVAVDHIAAQLQPWIARAAGDSSIGSPETICCSQWEPRLQIPSSKSRVSVSHTLTVLIRKYAPPELSCEKLREHARRMQRDLPKLFRFDDDIRRGLLAVLICRQHDDKAFDRNPLPVGRQPEQEIIAFADWFADFWVNCLGRENVCSQNQTGICEFVEKVLSSVTVGLSPSAQLVAALIKLADQLDDKLYVRIEKYLLEPLPSGGALASKVTGRLPEALKIIKVGLDGDRASRDGQQSASTRTM